MRGCDGRALGIICILIVHLHLLTGRSSGTMASGRMSQLTHLKRGKSMNIDTISAGSEPTSCAGPKKHRRKGRRVSAVTIAVLSASACTKVNSNVEAGTVILQCDGEQTAQVLTATTTSKREVYRLNGPAKSFEIWNEEKQRFNPWGDGRLDVNPTEISFISNGGGAVRNVHFDRTNGTVTDEINPLFGKLVFTGTCKPVEAPEPEQKTF